MLYRADGRLVDLRGLYKGKSLFLVLNGPSVANMDLAPLSQRGYITMAVNNGWSLLRPNLWVAVDPPSKFLDAGWKDPAITKFTIYPYRNMPLARRIPDGRIAKSGIRPSQCPATLFFNIDYNFHPATFLPSETFSTGGHDTEPDSLGIPRARSVMLVAIKLAWHLGFSRLYLLGADFTMDQQQPYAFDHEYRPVWVNHNNKTYDGLRIRLAALRPILEANGLTIINCTPGTHLTAFDCVDYEQALADAAESACGNLDTQGWYDGGGRIAHMALETRRG